MNYKTYADLSIDILEEINKIPPNIHLIVGVPRSGMMPAYIIGTYLNLPVVSLSEFLLGQFGMTGARQIEVSASKYENILVVDDSIYKGSAIQKAKEQLKGLGLNSSYFFCAIYSSSKDISLIDFYFKYLPHPRAFQWNYKNHFLSTKSCYDVDGVLCVDPTEAQNDDSENYRQFLLNAKPLFIPNNKISCLVTSRLEKYRTETERWLAEHNISYGELIMLDLPTAKKRRELKIHAKYKADIYMNRNEEFFIESSWDQAKTIYSISKKPVFCTYNDVLIQSDTDVIYYENQKQFTNRPLNDILSDNSDIGLKYNSLYKEFEVLRSTNLSLKTKILKFENNKWMKFSKYGIKSKILFLIAILFNKLGIKKTRALKKD